MLNPLPAIHERRKAQSNVDSAMGCVWGDGVLLKEESMQREMPQAEDPLADQGRKNRSDGSGTACFRGASTHSRTVPRFSNDDGNLHGCLEHPFSFQRL